ncbi:MAG: hypothetical protein EBT99_07535 [Betaproteobacteria bacterium]|jgi:hypothetical protein|nr:hypothetical protein [Betaproteobacteria bacterium]NCW25787.1 hypothetical protein [Betaproteobacteria bacterium]NDE47061.1 hypothetical protein [Betaproteobacteria bacterium]
MVGEFVAARLALGMPHGVEKVSKLHGFPLSGGFATLNLAKRWLQAGESQAIRSTLRVNRCPFPSLLF